MATHEEAVALIHSDFVDQNIEAARQAVRGFVKTAEEYPNPRFIIARYTAAIAVNFTDWMGKTYPWARHELAQHALKDNLRCEQMQDHVGMLLNFAAQANASPSEEHYMHVAVEVGEIRLLMSKVEDAGIVGLTILAILETMSEVFIPVLEKLGEQCGVSDFEYTRIHGVADVAHSKAFVAALKAEWSMGYTYHEGVVNNAVWVTVALLRRIFQDTHATTV